MDDKSLVYFEEFSRELKTKREYFSVLDEFYDYCKVDLLSVEPSHVQGFIDKLDNNKNTKRRKYHQLLSFYNFLFDRMAIRSNPVKNVPVPKAPKKINSERTISYDNVKTLLEHLKANYSKRDYVITLLIATTGMKLSEVRTLRWNDFFVDSSDKIGILVGGPDHGRYVRVFDFVWDEIDSFRRELGVTKDFLKSGGYLFFADNQRGNYLYNPSSVKPISPGWIKKVHTKACGELFIPLVTSKDLRHFYVMLCIRLGSPSESIKDQLGWSSSQFMFRYDGVVEMLDSPLNKAVENFFEKNK